MIKKILVAAYKNKLFKTLIRTLFRIKHQNEYRQIHTELLSKNRVIEIVFNDIKGKKELHTILKNAFHGEFIQNRTSYYFTPGAIIKLPENIESYLKHIGPKSRNMLKKAEKHTISYNVFDWNTQLDAIYEINTSSLFRQGKKMTSTYLNYPKALPKEDLSGEFKRVHIGGFLNNKLIGYVELCIYGNFAMCNRILGHKDHLPTGLMNLLIYGCVDYGIKHSAFIYLNYLSMRKPDTNSLSGFKARVGFENFSILTLK